jgi:transcriptional regulator with XRE-family HTH domain
MSRTDHIEPFSLRAARLNRGKSIRQLAREIKIAQATLSRLESGEAVHPESALKVAKFFKVKVTDLMDVERAAA